MKTFFYKVLFLYLTIISTYSILTYNWVPLNYKSHYLNAAYDKLELLANKKSPRILFSGGSSCSFGINTEKIETLFNFDVYNLGLHSALGVKYYLDQLLYHSKENDIIFLVFEHFMPYEGNPALLDRLKPIKNPDTGMMLSLRNNFINNYEYFENIFSSKRTISSTLSFNENGDFIGHLNKNSIKFLSEKAIFKNIDLISVFNNFYNSLKQKGAKVYILYPPLMESSIVDNYAEVLKIINEFERAVEIPILCKFEDSIYGDQLFFNQNYHLNKDGRHEYTNDIINIIKEKKIL